MQSVPTVLATGAHIRAIDGLRGVAILLVFMHHFGLFQPGWAGVDIFFVISGFLITGILLRTKHSPHYFGHFYARRALRILPLYYIFIVLFFLVIFPIAARLGSSSHYGLTDFTWFLFHLSNWWIGSGHMSSSPISHFWSLAIEEQYYFVWPLLVLLLSRRNLARASIAIALLSFSCRVVDAALHPEGIGFNFYTPFRIEPIAIGSLAAILALDQQLWDKLVSYRQILFWGGFVLWATTIFVGDNRAICVLGISAIGALALAMLIDATTDRSPFDTTFFRHLGKHSYALYVIHYPIFLLASHTFQGWGRFWHPVLTAVVGVPVSYVLARASWVLIESPFLRLKVRFKYEADSAQEVVPTEFSTNSIPAKL
jgi:peptidoglycan/LPS O-acetylase OafA/YrhL